MHGLTYLKNTLASGVKTKLHVDYRVQILKQNRASSLYEAQKEGRVAAEETARILLPMKVFASSTHCTEVRRGTAWLAPSAVGSTALCQMGSTAIAIKRYEQLHGMPPPALP